MNWYSLYKYAVRMHEINEFPSNDLDRDLEEIITTLHELEYKTYYLSTLKDYADITPIRKKNTIERLRQIGWKYFKISRDAIIETFENWKSKHQIQNADNWAEELFNNYALDYGDDEKTVRAIIEDSKGISLGHPSLGINITIEDIVSNVDKEKIKSIISENLYYYPEMFESTIESFLNEEYEEEFENSDEDAVEFMKENDLEDKALEYIFSTTDFEDFISDYDLYYLIDKEDVIKAIKEILYPLYIDNFGRSIEDVIKNINTAEDRLNTISYKDNIGSMAIAVSLSLNVMHVFGNILTDYGGEISSEYLNWLANETDEIVKEWETEVKQDFSASRGQPNYSLENSANLNK